MAIILFTVIIIIKTEKELKKVFELFFVSFSILFLSSVFGLNRFFEIITPVEAELALVISRLISLIFVFFACFLMMKLVKNMQSK
jgi:hypothetical protein